MDPRAPLPAGDLIRLDIVLSRVRDRLVDVDLDCRCRAEVKDRLDSLAEDGRREALLGALSQARAMRAAIGGLLAFLDELDGMGPDEDDLSAFAEAAGIFDDIDQAAASGAAALRRCLALSASKGGEHG